VVVAGLATPIVLLLAWLSWHLVEKVAMSYKDRGFGQTARASAAMSEAG
jgi:peptidoglycan/LPS O-acetylase OafA/YrhL